MAQLPYPAFFQPKAVAAQSPEPAVVWDAELTHEIPLQNFLADIDLASGFEGPINVWEVMGGRCTGFNVLNQVGVIQYSINNGGWRVCPGADFNLSGSWIRTLSFKVSVGGSATLQLQGV